jgi:hypothetical protein
MLLLMLVAVMSLTGCVCGSPVKSSGCEWVRPIIMDQADQITRGTLEQIVAHDIAWLEQIVAHDIAWTKICNDGKAPGEE